MAESAATAERPPGPRGLPLLGTLPAFGRDPLRFLVEVGQTYGDIAHTRIGTASTYLIYEPQRIEELLVGRHRECVKDFGTRELIPLVGYGLLTSDGEFWRRQRRLASPALTPTRIARCADTMVTCAERTFAGFRDEEVRDVHVDMMALTLEIVGKTLLDFDTRGETERVSNVMDVALAYLETRLLSWRGVLPAWLPTPRRYAFRRAVAELDAIVFRMIERARSEQGDAESLLYRLAHARDDSGETMSDAQLRDEAVTMLLAGHETTALALTFAVHSLSEHPEVAARLREEVAETVGERPVALDDLQRLRYVDAVVRETLRLYPPVYAMAREVARPFELGGYPMRVGEQIMMSPYAVHRDVRLYPEPGRFLPERWLDGSRDDLPRFAYFPFGGGPRVCIGMHFAMMEAVLVLATLVQQVELVVVPGYELALSPVVTLRPKDRVPVLVRRRGHAPRSRRTAWSGRAPQRPPAAE